MSDNGFVKRPKPTPSEARRAEWGSVLQRLRQTADNGKAVPFRNPPGHYKQRLRDEGLRVRIATQPDGTYLAWCERVPPAAGASA